MSAQASIVLNDSLAVVHTFAPKGAKRGPDGKDVALWRDQSPTNMAGFLTLNEYHSAPNANGVEKFRVVLDVPTLESPSSGGSFVPPPTRAYGTIGVIEIWAHQRASLVELNNIAAYIKNYTATAYFAALIANREPAW